MPKDNSDNSLVHSLLRDAELAGIDLGTPPPERLKSDDLFLAHKQVKIQQDAASRTETLKEVNRKRSATKTSRVSNSVAEAEAKEQQARLQVAADQLTDEEVSVAQEVDAEPETETEAKPQTSRRRSTKKES